MQCHVVASQCTVQGLGGKDSYLDVELSGVRDIIITHYIAASLITHRSLAASKCPTRRRCTWMLLARPRFEAHPYLTRDHMHDGVMHIRT